MSLAWKFDERLVDVDDVTSDDDYQDWSDAEDEGRQRRADERENAEREAGEDREADRGY